MARAGGWVGAWVCAWREWVGGWVHGCMARVGGWVGAWVHGAEFRTNHTFRGELVDVWRVSHGEVERSYRRPHVLHGMHAIHDAKSNEVMR
jgi:hypothetical protein